jgi:Domain of unknown function (DUF4926)
MHPYQVVRLLTNNYQNEGIKKGDIGSIIEDYGDNHYEVEFSDSNGITIALLALPGGELEVIDN